MTTLHPCSSSRGSVLQEIVRRDDDETFLGRVYTLSLTLSLSIILYSLITYTALK